MSETQIGYKQPPKATQFRKGTSGNPAGRPKRQPSIKDDIDDAMQELTDLSGNRVTVQRALVKKLIIEALAGDSKALIAALRFLTQYSGDQPDDDPRADDDARFVAELAGSEYAESKGSDDDAA